VLINEVTHGAKVYGVLGEGGDDGLF